MLINRIVEPGVPWTVTKTTRLYRLTIREGAVVSAPPGKFVTLTVNGCGRPVRPGTYTGDVVVSVTDSYRMGVHGIMVISGRETDLKQAAVIRDNRILPEYTVPAVLQDAVLGETETDGLYLASAEEDFNGLVLDGNTRYAIRNSVFDMEGSGHNDWVGVGSAITAIDDVRLDIDSCRFTFSGVTRCALQVGGRSEVNVRNSRLINIGPNGEDWVGDFSWAVGFRGFNRVAQLCDCAKVRYENCEIQGNGWGLLSIDGSDEPVDMYVKDCRLTLSGPYSHGYGAFCIGDNHISYDHCDVDVYGYPILLMGMEGKGRFDVKNGTKIRGRRFGALIIDDDNSVLNISDSSFRTGKSSLCVKGSSTVINAKNTRFSAANGTVLQLMDCDETNMVAGDFKIPVRVEDIRDESRDLTAVSPTEDVTMNLTDCDVEGNFYNSTTNIRATEWSSFLGMGKLQDAVLGAMPMPGEGPGAGPGVPDQAAAILGESPRPSGGAEDGPPPEEMGGSITARHHGDDLKGAKNLGLNLVSSTVTGVISAAKQYYREGLNLITPDNREELSNVTQTAAEPVNNGVVVSLDAASKWIVTDTSYITALHIAEGGVVAAPEGKSLRMTVDGAETAAAPGSYAGRIELQVY